MADLSITAANVKPSSKAQYGVRIAGATITQGQAIALNDTGALVPYDASNVNHVYAGIALSAASADQPFVLCVSDNEISIGGSTVSGTIYVGSTNAGNITTSADLSNGDLVSVIGIGLGGGKMKLVKPSEKIRAVIPT